MQTNGHINGHTNGHTDRHTSGRAPEYDAIVIGSGTAGATIARELTRRKKKVLILERGGNTPLKEKLSTVAAIADQVKVGDGRLQTTRALTTGGTTSLYFGVAHDPRLDVFQGLGIDLSAELREVRRELPIAPLPDELITEQGRRLQDTAISLGHDWQKNDMLVDQSKCKAGYSYDAKWKARSFVDEALQNGASLVNRANVQQILVNNKQ